MPQKLIQMGGQKFGRLSVLRLVASTTSHGSRWLCRCDCGVKVTVYGHHLRQGRMKSCGCWHAEGKSPIHGHAGRETESREYQAWCRMIQRCENESSPDYKRYGGRGIRVYSGWRRDFMAFYSHIGPRPSALYSIDRKDNNRGYEPGNVRWATPKQQANNRRPAKRPSC